LGGDHTETAAGGERAGPGISADEIIPAVERIVMAYLDLRDTDEEFLATYRRVGLAPFKAVLYPEAQANAA
jgi:sulfite reductase (NADPH) hemoprotein beta-component